MSAASTLVIASRPAAVAGEADEEVLRTAPAPSATTSNLIAVVVAACCLVAYAVATMDPGRSALAAPLAIATAAWAVAVCAVVAREPTRRMRISDPGILVLLWSAYYFLWPTVQWAQGKTFWLEGDFQLSVAAVARVQLLHAIFVLGFGLTWAAVRPRMPSAPLGPEAVLTLPRGTVMLAIGLLPVGFEAIRRVATTGSLRATQEYGEQWFKLQDSVNATRSAGSSEYVVTQLMGKVWFISPMVLGVGLGLLMTRLLAQKRWLHLALFHAIFPVLMYLTPGGRSAVIAPYIMALVIADALVGPLPWRFVGAVAGVGTAFFNFYGVFRGVQSQQISLAIEATQTSIDSATVVQTEDSTMLVKEAFAVVWTDSTGYSRGLSYFTESTLSLLPGQILPEKLSWMNTATLLSRELLGSDAQYGAGVAGSVIADGYMMYQELGVLILAVFNALLLTVTVRALLRQPDRARLWRHLLLATFASQAFLFIRGDLLLVLNQIVFFVFVPAAVIQLLLMRRPSAIWQRPLLAA